MASKAPQPDRAPFRAFCRGLRAPLDGWRYMRRNSGLWRHAAVPILINTLITTCMLFGMLGGVWVFWKYWAFDFGPGAAWGTLEVILDIVATLAIVGAALVVAYLLNGILCDYFRSILAQKVEISLGMKQEDLCEVPITYQVVDAFRDLAGLVFYNLAFLLLNFIPVVGTAVAAGASLYYECCVFGIDFIDYPMALRGMRRKDKYAFARRHRMHVLGLGAVTFAASFIPVLGAVVLATAATGAVLLYRDILAESPENQSV